MGMLLRTIVNHNMDLLGMLPACTGDGVVQDLPINRSLSVRSSELLGCEGGAQMVA